MISEELGNLIAALLDRQLDEKGRARLAELLAEDRAARDYYRQYVDLHVSLQAKHISTPEILPRMRRGVDEASDDVLPKIEVQPDALSRRIKRWDSIHWQRHKIRFNAMTAVLTALAWVGFSLFVWLTTTPDVSRPKRDGINVNFVAHITGQYEHRWAEGMHGMPPNAFLVPGERLNLVEGLIEITFYDGAKVVLEGPAEFVIDSAGAGTLEQGRLSANISERSIGFVVDTPMAQVVDLGTRFTVVVDQDETTVSVHDGRVTVQRGRGPAVELTAGRGWNCERGGRPRIVEFVTIDPLVMPARTGVVAGLLAYWKLDETSGTVAVDSSGNGNDAVFNPNSGTPVWLSTGGVIHGAVDLDGIDDFFTVPDGLDILNQSFSMSFWSKRDVSTRREFVFGQGDNTSTGTFLQVGFYEDDYKFGFRGVTFDHDILGISVAADTTNYHHWVSTFESTTNTSRTYVDGVLIDTKILEGDLSRNSGAKDFWIGQRDDGTPDRFEGLLDEVAVWNRALTSDEAAAIYNGGNGINLTGVNGETASESGGRSGDTVNVGASNSQSDQ